MNSFVKITIGFVHQIYEKDSDDIFVCTEQSFIAGDEESFEDKKGRSLDGVPEYQAEHMEMKPPQGKARKVKYTLYNDTLGASEEEEFEADSYEEALEMVLSGMGYSVSEIPDDEDDDDELDESDL